MQTLSEKLDHHLLDLAWSLWTELGVRGVRRRHQKFLIAPEELILLTTVLGKKDPRLLNEALDWCARYHSLISISRLKTLAKALGKDFIEALSIFSATLNSISQSHWPLLTQASPLPFAPSGKSQLPPLQSPALLYVKLRSLFGVGARADVIAFCLMEKKSDFAVSDTVDIGYTKRNLADVLEGFARAGIFEVWTVRNQLRYAFAKRDQIANIMGPLPEFAPSWRHVFEVLLILRTCIQKTARQSESTKVVEVRNTLIALEETLHKLNLTVPPMQSDFHAYWNSFTEWILGIAQSLAEGRFGQV